jgi:hypothetical protein
MLLTTAQFSRTNNYQLNLPILRKIQIASHRGACETPARQSQKPLFSYDQAFDRCQSCFDWRKNFGLDKQPELLVYDGTHEDQSLLWLATAYLHRKR